MASIKKLKTKLAKFEKDKAETEQRKAADMAVYDAKIEALQAQINQYTKVIRSVEKHEKEINALMNSVDELEKPSKKEGEVLEDSDTGSDDSSEAEEEDSPEETADVKRTDEAEDEDSEADEFEKESADDTETADDDVEFITDTDDADKNEEASAEPEESNNAKQENHGFPRRSFWG